MDNNKIKKKKLTLSGSSSSQRTFDKVTYTRGQNKTSVVVENKFSRKKNNPYSHIQNRNNIQKRSSFGEKKPTKMPFHTNHSV